jgi:hypothetical protein
MYHCNLMALFPGENLMKNMWLKYFLSEDDMIMYRKEQKDLYNQHVAFDKEHPEIFSFAVLGNSIASLREGRFNVFNSITTMLDFVILVVTLSLGIYTLCLAFTTINFVRNESSLIDYLKV